LSAFADPGSDDAIRSTGVLTKAIASGVTKGLQAAPAAEPPAAERLSAF
jgi:hypothetical protein